MQATAKTAEMETHSGHAAWRLRYAFDIYLSMLRYSNPESLQCTQRFVSPVMSNSMTSSGTSSDNGESASEGGSNALSAEKATAYSESEATTSSAEVAQNTGTSGVVLSFSHPWIL